MRGAHREAQTPAPCNYYVSAEYRLAVESYYMIISIIAHLNRLVARQSIKRRMSYAHSVELKMFARGSLTRVVWIKSLLSLSRGVENT